MKAYFVIVILGIALWWEYQNRLSKTPGKSSGRVRRNPRGVAATTGSGVRQATQFSTTGSASPGSGVLPVQPSLLSTWGVAGQYGIGLTGPSYSPHPSTK